MAADRSQNLQDTFLNHVRKSKTPLTIFLVNGVKLQGVVTWFDNFCVLLRRDGHAARVQARYIHDHAGSPDPAVRRGRGELGCGKGLIGTASSRPAQRSPELE